MIDPTLGKSAVGTAKPAVAPTSDRTAARPVPVIGAVVMLVRLLFSERARSELHRAAGELESAVNEVNARLSRMTAAKHGGRAPLRLVPSIGLCDEFTHCPGRLHASNDRTYLGNN